MLYILSKSLGWLAVPEGPLVGEGSPGWKERVCRLAKGMESRLLFGLIGGHWLRRRILRNPVRLLGLMLGLLAMQATFLVGTAFAGCTITYPGGVSTFSGTNSADSCTGSSARDIMYAYDGGDTFTGEAGNDELHGGDGGIDRMSGNSGTDDVSDRAGSYDTDILCGGPDNDSLDTIDGDSKDTLHGGGGFTAYSIDGGDYADPNLNCPF